MATDNHLNPDPAFSWDEGMKRYEKARKFMGDNAMTDTMDKIAAGRNIRKARIKNKRTRVAKRALKSAVAKNPKVGPRKMNFRGR